MTKLETDWWEPPEWADDRKTTALPVKKVADYGADTLWGDGGGPLSPEFVAGFAAEQRSAEDEAFVSAEEMHEADALSNARVKRKISAQQKALRKALPQLTPKQRF